jgi:hypothetical protein
MAKAKIVEPVMHVEATDFEGVEKLGTKLINTGLYFNTTDFPNPTIALTDFKPEVLLLNNLIAAAKGNTAILKQRDEQSVVVHSLIKQDLMYVKPICIGDYTLINKSGFDPSIPAAAHPLAPKAVIKKIVKGPGFNTIKVMLVKASGEEALKRENRSYIVLVYEINTGKLLRTGCVSTNSRKLLVPEVPLMTPFDYVVAIQNAAGINEPSAKMKFTLTD